MVLALILVFLVYLEWLVATHEPSAAQEPVWMLVTLMTTAALAVALFAALVFFHNLRWRTKFGDTVEPGAWRAWLRKFQQRKTMAFLSAFGLLMLSLPLLWSVPGGTGYEDSPAADTVAIASPTGVPASSRGAPGSPPTATFSGAFPPPADPAPTRVASAVSAASPTTGRPLASASVPVALPAPAVAIARGVPTPINSRAVPDKGVEPVRSVNTATGLDTAKGVALAIHAWAQAWEQGLVDQYLAMYSPHFTPANGTTRNAWEQTRRQRVSKARGIKMVFQT